MKFPWTPVVEVVDDLIGLGAEYIVDKDKLIEFQFKALQIKQDSLNTLLGVKTVPWVDAFVKILAAFNMFWRPVGSAMMTAFGAYCHFKGIALDPILHTIFDGAFPAWGTSRHIEKSKKAEAKKYNFYPDGEDPWG